MRKRRITSTAILIAIFSPLVYMCFCLLQGGRLLSHLHTGMSREEVIAVLGPASHIRSDDRGERWDYATSRLPDAAVKFDTNGMVVSWASK